MPTKKSQETEPESQQEETVETESLKTANTLTDLKKRPFDPLRKASADLQGPAALECELRGLIKRNGGYCKNLSPKQKARADELLKLLDRNEPKWDLNINLPGFFDPNVKG